KRLTYYQPFYSAKGASKKHQTAWRRLGADCRARFWRGRAMSFLIAHEYEAESLSLGGIHESIFLRAVHHGGV
ncbi:MAG: hypothetical protein IJ822_02820, partial [Pyramidobacter sp.]|nr:hypothetical protein [Pyramidobacter sp.]